MSSSAPSKKSRLKIPRHGNRDGRVRAVIDRVLPEIDGGRFPVKRILGESMVVEADAFADGDDALACMLGFRHEGDADWREAPMTPLVNDRWRGEFTLQHLGRYRYTVTAWVDHFLSWRAEFERRVDPADIASAALVGGKLIAEAANRASRADAHRLRAWGKELIAASETEEVQRIALDEELALIARRCPDRRFATVYEKELTVVVDRERARFSSWYEMFPRSASPEPGRHGTFKDCEARLAYIAELGFDILYLPPVHPIGRIRRKGGTTHWKPGLMRWAAHGP